MKRKELLPFCIWTTALIMGACGSKTSTFDTDKALDYCAHQVAQSTLPALLSLRTIPSNLSRMRRVWV